MSSQALAPKIEQLVQALIDQTSDRAIQWVVTPSENVFRFVSESAIVQIGKVGVYDDQTGDANIDCSVLVFDKKAKLVADFHPKSQQQANTLDELFSLARRSAHNTDVLLDQLLEEIGGKRPQ